MPDTILGCATVGQTYCTFIGHFDEISSCGSDCTEQSRWQDGFATPRTRIKQDYICFESLLDHSKQRSAICRKRRRKSEAKTIARRHPRGVDLLAQLDHLPAH